MFHVFRSIIIISSLFSLNSCLVSEAFTMPESWNWQWWKARPYMARGLPDGDTDYHRGFRDGCKGSLGMVAQGPLRNTQGAYDGWKLTSSDLYATGFYDGEEHCAYIFDWDII